MGRRYTGDMSMPPSWSYQSSIDFLLLTVDNHITKDNRRIMVNSRCIVTATEHIRNGEVAGSMLTMSNDQRIYVTQKLADIAGAFSR